MIVNKNLITKFIAINNNILNEQDACILHFIDVFYAFFVTL